MTRSGKNKCIYVQNLQTKAAWVKPSPAPLPCCGNIPDATATEKLHEKENKSEADPSFFGTHVIKIYYHVTYCPWIWIVKILFLIFCGKDNIFCKISLAQKLPVNLSYP